MQLQDQTGTFFAIFVVQLRYAKNDRFNTLTSTIKSQKTKCANYMNGMNTFLFMPLIKKFFISVIFHFIDCLIRPELCECKNERNKAHKNSQS